MEFPPIERGKYSNRNEVPTVPLLLILLYTCRSNVPQWELSQSLKYRSKLWTIDVCLVLVTFQLLQYMSECRNTEHDTELLSIVLLFCVTKEWSILCETALLIRDESWYFRIVNLFLDNWGEPRYRISSNHHDISKLRARKKLVQWCC